MAILAFAVPIVAGRSDEVRRLGADLERLGLRARYEELNRRAGLRRHMEWIESTPNGDRLLVLFETDTPERLARPFGDDEYDRWWVGRFQRVHGFDPAKPGPPPELTWSWEEVGLETH
jgi:hypothetical protein